MDLRDLDMIYLGAAQSALLKVEGAWMLRIAETSRVRV